MHSCRSDEAAQVAAWPDPRPESRSGGGLSNVAPHRSNRSAAAPDHGRGTYPEVTMDSIYHLAAGAEWSEAIESGGPYSRSTLGKSLADEGFIHCSLASQVGAIADAV